MSASEPNEFSRRGFLAAAGVTAAAAGAFVAVGSPSAAGATSRLRRVGGVHRAVPAQSASDDLKIAAFAASLEVVATLAYRKVLAAATSGSLGTVPPAGAEFVQTAVAQHEAQAAKWNSVLDAAGAPGVLAPDKTLQGVVDQRLPGVTDFGQAAMLARDLEEIAAATYLSAIPKLSDADAIQLAGSIQIIDMQHVAILNYVLGDYPVPDVFAKTDKAATPPAA
jgi:Ferritin-like domain